LSEHTSENTSTKFKAFTRTTQQLYWFSSSTQLQQGVKQQMLFYFPGSPRTPNYQKPSCARKAAVCSTPDWASPNILF